QVEGKYLHLLSMLENQFVPKDIMNPDPRYKLIRRRIAQIINAWMSVFFHAKRNNSSEDDESSSMQQRVENETDLFVEHDRLMKIMEVIHRLLRDTDIVTRLYAAVAFRTLMDDWGPAVVNAINQE